MTSGTTTYRPLGSYQKNRTYSRTSEQVPSAPWASREDVALTCETRLSQVRYFGTRAGVRGRVAHGRGRSAYPAILVGGHARVG